MKVVILAAGRGTRMGALTENVPKPLLEIAGKTLLEHKFDMLPDQVTEIVLVVGYHGPKVRERLGDNYGARAISYVSQDILDGTAGALWQARELLEGRFLVMMGDDLYAKRDIEACIAAPGWAVLVSPTPSMRSGGCVEVDDAGIIIGIVEGEHVGPGLMNTNMLALDTRVFDTHLVPKAPGSSEYGLPQTVIAAAANSNVQLTAVTATKWIQVTSPEDLPSAEAALSSL